MNKDRGCQGDNIPLASKLKTPFAGTLRPPFAFALCLLIFTCGSAGLR
jgi:hypothetical protein